MTKYKVGLIVQTIDERIVEAKNKKEALKKAIDGKEVTAVEMCGDIEPTGEAEYIEVV